MSGFRWLVSLVAWNSAGEIGHCLESLEGQTCRDFRVRILDNASADGTVEACGPFLGERVELVRSPENLGYSAGHNRLLADDDSPWILFLNPDTELAPDFLERAADLLARHPECGSLSPRLERMAGPAEGFARLPLLDSTGMYWTKTLRHLDRGGGESAAGRYPDEEYVFGVTGAAAVYRRACLEDVAFRGEIWDEDFFAYREDADLAWRAAWRGWKCLYAPALRAWHVRRVLPSRRRDYAAEINRGSVRNRFLLRLKNLPAGLGWRLAPWILWRDLQVAGGVLLREWSSLPAFWQVLRLYPAFLAKRRHVLGRRRVPDREMARWFSCPAQAVE